MKTMARVVLLLMLASFLGCSDDDDDNGAQDAAVASDSFTPGDSAVVAGDGPQPTGDLAPQPASDGGGTLPSELATWCVGTTAKFRIGTQDQTAWTGMDAPGAVTGTVMTIEPQFVVNGVKHSFLLTLSYTKTTISPVKVDLANLGPGDSVQKDGADGPVVPADQRQGIVEIVALSGGGFMLQVCATVAGESFYFPGMPMG